MEKMTPYEFIKVKTIDTFMEFEFISSGCKGEILKLITFCESPIKEIYHIEFGDKIIGTEKIDKNVVSNNGDGEKIFASIFAAICVFTKKNPYMWIHFTGTTKARTRFFQIRLTKYYDELIQDHVILGLIDYEWEVYKKNLNFSSFIFKRKGLLPEKPNPAFVQLIYKLPITMESKCFKKGCR